ncbi:hypothetical protein AYO21_06169 [Fonsecaea monophora]|uniref:Zn(2)-C6 fungal-type domain-containing protein n=1 Tax=Fonsecaea monophora TaxID=254056 RepID=A0A177F5M4_9EURO|nr:hypothetical protein AYO21_06169 [Fonsecaea monophora]OAG39525.1 hypothetical protein AYO21_06169 [Fonsecaea monophora]
MSHCGYFSRARSKGDKLGYYRASVACGHCRKRKARCRPAVGDPLRRCANCVRLGYPCVVVKVEVMEALDILGEDGTPENILRVQRLIGHVKTGTPAESCQQTGESSTSWTPTLQQPTYIDPATAPSPWPCQMSTWPQPPEVSASFAHPSSSSGFPPHSCPVSEHSWQHMPTIPPSQAVLNIPEAPTSDIFYGVDNLAPANLDNQSMIRPPTDEPATNMSSWQSMCTPLSNDQALPAMHATWGTTARKQYSGLR